MLFLCRLLIFIVAPLCVSFTFANQKVDTSNKYFDTSFLRNYDAVEQDLVENHQFERITFTTSDNFKLHGLLLERPAARYDIVLCAGFYPGRKEGMATFLYLLPDDCNILFFDARGHNKSEGPFVSTLYCYGSQEYKDVLGALHYMHVLHNNPLVIHAVCAGAFHAAQALIVLEQEQQFNDYNIQGLIFDSGITSIPEGVGIPRHHIIERSIASLLRKSLYTRDTIKEISQRRLYKMICSALKCVAYPFEQGIKRVLSYHHDTDLVNSIANVSCPIFYIHAQNDTYTLIKNVQKMADNTTRKTCWWIENSKHANNHLKYAQDYKNKLTDFLQQTVLPATSFTK